MSPVVLLNVGETILSLVLFLIALSVLVTIHELGHFIAAKSFKVYCSDFSIGFGPKIVKIKRKKGETTFNIGILPFGGYVSMLGDEDSDAELPEGVTVPKERTLSGIARRKRIIIMAAGITMNFILAYVIFFICASSFPQVQVYDLYDVNEEVASTYLSYDEDSEEKFAQNDTFYVYSYTYDEKEDLKWRKTTTEDRSNSYATVVNILHEGYIESGANDGKKYVACLSYSFSNGINNTDFTRNILLYETSDEYKNDAGIYLPLIESGKVKSYTYNDGDSFTLPLGFLNALSNDPLETKEEATNAISNFEKDSDGNYKVYRAYLKLEISNSAIKEVGISFHKVTYWNGWNSFAKAGDLWVESTTLISEALGRLFVGKGWDQIGGPLAIFTQTTSVLENNPFNYYLQTWGVISVNLALFNLLPFPGLDGWQILVEIVEGSVNGIKKLVWKSKNGKSKKSGSSTEKEVIDINANDVTTNKDTNLTIGQGTVENSYVEWKIPAKIKSIMSYVGLGLLLVLMVFVVIKDIMGLF